MHGPSSGVSPTTTEWQPLSHLPQPSFGLHLSSVFGQQGPSSRASHTTTESQPHFWPPLPYLPKPSFRLCSQVCYVSMVETSVLFRTAAGVEVGEGGGYNWLVPGIAAAVPPRQQERESCNNTSSVRRSRPLCRVRWACVAMFVLLFDRGHARRDMVWFHALMHRHRLAAGTIFFLFPHAMGSTHGGWQVCVWQ